MNITAPFTALAAKRWPTARSAEASVMSTGSPGRQKAENLPIAVTKWLRPGAAPPADASGRAADVYGCIPELSISGIPSPVILAKPECDFSKVFASPLTLNDNSAGFSQSGIRIFKANLEGLSSSRIISDFSSKGNSVSCIRVIPPSSQDKTEGIKMSDLFRGRNSGSNKAG